MQPTSSAPTTKIGQSAPANAASNREVRGRGVRLSRNASASSNAPKVVISQPHRYAFNHISITHPLWHPARHPRWAPGLSNDRQRDKNWPRKG